MENEIVANLFSMLAIICGVFLRGPQVYRIYTTKPLNVNDLSTETMILNLGTNRFILVYMIIHSQYPIIAYCSIMILLELLLIYMKNTHGNMKKSSSQTNLLEMEDV